MAKCKAIMVVYSYVAMCSVVQLYYNLIQYTQYQFPIVLVS